MVQPVPLLLFATTKTYPFGRFNVFILRGTFSELLGRMLGNMEKATGGQYGGKTKIDGTRSAPSNPPATLAELGLDK